MLPTIVRCLLRSTQSSATCPSSRTAILDSYLVALITSSCDTSGRIVHEARERTLNGEHRDWPPVYFAGAITGGRGDVESYGRIVARLRERGVPVHGIHIASPELAATGETI